MRFAPLMLIDDAVVQAVLATLWTFSTRTVADGALLLSAWLEIIMLRHHCRIKGWQYLRAALQVCYFNFTVHGAVCCVCCNGVKGSGT